MYGSTTRLTGATRIADAGAYLRIPDQCIFTSILAGLGDLDGDGKADFALGEYAVLDSNGPAEILVFHRRSERLSGTVDLV